MAMTEADQRSEAEAEAEAGLVQLNPTRPASPEREQAATRLFDFTDAGQYRVLYRSRRDYLETCAHVGCSLQAELSSGSAYCTDGHRSLASQEQKFAFEYRGGFVDLNDLQTFCCICLFNKCRGLAIGVPTFPTGELFTTLPSQPSAIFRINPMEKCDFLFFSTPPTAYSRIKGTDLMWHANPRMSVELQGFPPHQQVLFTSHNLIDRSFLKRWTLWARSNNWTLYLFECGMESLYCLSYSTGIIQKEPKAKTHRDNKRPPRPPNDGPGPKPKDTASTSSGIKKKGSSRIGTTSGAKGTTSTSSARVVTIREALTTLDFITPKAAEEPVWEDKDFSEKQSPVDYFPSEGVLSNGGKGTKTHEATRAAATGQEAADPREINKKAALFGVNEKLLCDTLSAFGVIASNPKIMLDPDTGNSRGFGFICYDSFEGSDAAIEVIAGQYLCNPQITSKAAEEPVWDDKDFSEKQSAVDYFLSEGVLSNGGNAQLV